MNDNNSEVSLRDISMVKEFSDVFLEELFGLPLDQEIKFSIDLLLALHLCPKHLTTWHLLNWRNLKFNCKDFLIKVLFALVYLLGELWYCLWRRKMVLCSYALITDNWTQLLSRIDAHFSYWWSFWSTTRCSSILKIWIQYIVLQS